MFEKALEITLGHEGGYANVKGDKGGETYKGIARNFFPNWPGWNFVDHEKAANGGTLPRNYFIKDLSLDKLVQDFYYQTFWLPIHLDKVNDSSLQEIIFDFYVNSRNSGIKVLQSVLANQFNQKIAIDGIMGMQTVTAINNCDPEQLFNAIKNARIDFYKRIAKKGDNAKFLRGWLKRIGQFNYVGVGVSVGLLLGAAIAGFFLFKSLAKKNEKSN